MGFYKDITGKTYSTIKVNSFAYNKHGHSYWNCTCLNCGEDCVRQITYILHKKNPVCSKCALIRMGNDIKENDVEIKGDYAIINGDVLVDTEDLPRLLSYHRYVTKGTRGYAQINYDGGVYSLHRLIMGLPRKYDKETTLIVDHINGDQLDNRKKNLRICRKEKNPMNCKLYKNNKSGYKGISYIKKLNKWQANVSKKGKTIYLGVYENLEDAVRVRKKAEKEYYGEFLRQT